MVALQDKLSSVHWLRLLTFTMATNNINCCVHKKYSLSFTVILPAIKTELLKSFKAACILRMFIVITAKKVSVCFMSE